MAARVAQSHDSCGSRPEKIGIGRVLEVLGDAHAAGDQAGATGEGLERGGAEVRVLEAELDHETTPAGTMGAERMGLDDDDALTRPARSTMSRKGATLPEVEYTESTITMPGPLRSICRARCSGLL